ncbi:Fc.00g015490.m01.CDS01 [Cosmosporella sp. VM-42]
MLFWSSVAHIVVPSRALIFGSNRAFKKAKQRINYIVISIDTDARTISPPHKQYARYAVLKRFRGADRSPTDRLL